MKLRDRLGQKLQVLFRREPADVADDECIVRECSCSRRNRAVAAGETDGTSTPVGMISIRVSTPRSRSISATLWLGAITASHRLA